MSYTFLQEQGVVSSVESYSGIPPYVLSRLNLSAGKFCCNDSGMESYQSFQSGMMYEHSMEAHGEDLSMSCAEDSHARISARPGAQTGQELKENKADYGVKWPGLFARWSPASSSWKIPQLSLSEGLEESLRIWPRWGLMHDGECFRLPMLEHDTSVKEFGYWGGIGTPIKTQRCRSEDFCKGRMKNPYELCPHGWLPNPRWVESLMGWPHGWTNLQPLAMDKFHKWRHMHGGRLSKGLKFDEIT